MFLELPQRQELIVWLKNMKKIRYLYRYGKIYYVSKRRRYAILYTDKGEEVIQNLSSLDFVKEVSLSPRQTINYDFSVALEPEAERAERLKKENDFEYPLK